MTVLSLSSLTRISDLAERRYDIQPVPKDQWATGDYVVGKVSPAAGRSGDLELACGRMVTAMPGDEIVGALGNRAATLEGVGGWADIEGGRMQGMTSAGLFGGVTSWSSLIVKPLDHDYQGHVLRDGRKVCMPDFAIAAEEAAFDVPTIMLVGTSMSSGKTTTGRLIVHELERMGLRVVGAKLTGAGRYRDVLSFRDAGASAVFDFVDAGLPSTVVPEDEFRAAIRPLLWHIAGLQPDILVAEAGASPLEPYNGMAAMDELGDNICATVLCASDPYSVVGVQQAFGLEADLISGPATSTSAAIDLVGNLAGVEAINVMDPDCLPQLRSFLERVL